MLPSYFHVSSEIVGVTVLPKPFMMSGKIRNILTWQLFPLMFYFPGQ